MLAAIINVTAEAPTPSTNSRPNLDPDAPDEGEQDEDMEDEESKMMALMGLQGFGTTKVSCSSALEPVDLIIQPFS